MWQKFQNILKQSTTEETVTLYNPGKILSFDPLNNSLNSSGRKYNSGYKLSDCDLIR